MPRSSRFFGLLVFTLLLAAAGGSLAWAAAHPERSAARAVGVTLNAGPGGEATAFEEVDRGGGERDRGAAALERTGTGPRALPARRRRLDRGRAALDRGDADHADPGRDRDHPPLRPTRPAPRDLGQPADDHPLPPALAPPRSPAEPAGPLRLDRERGRRVLLRPPRASSPPSCASRGSRSRSAPARPLGEGRRHRHLLRPDRAAPVHREDARPPRRRHDPHLLPALRGYRMRPPGAPLRDLPRMVRIADGRPLVLQEAGYSSSPRLGGSPSAQATFVRNVFAAWDRSPTAIPSSASTPCSTSPRASVAPTRRPRPSSAPSASATAVASRSPPGQPSARAPARFAPVSLRSRRRR